MTFVARLFRKFGPLGGWYLAARLYDGLPVAVGLLRSTIVLGLAVMASTTAADSAQGFSAALYLPEIRLLIVALVALEMVSLLRSMATAPRAAPAVQRHAMVSPPDFMAVLDRCFAEWALSGSERTVALYAIKGFSNAEIAHLRDTVEATVKCQLNAVYRKAAVTGRSQLISTVLDEVLVILPQAPSAEASAKQVAQQA